MDVSLFDYTLPESLIAQTPAADRTGSRLLCLDRDGGKVSHHIFAELIQFLEEGDTLVLNDTKVIPARLFGVKSQTGAKVEVLLLRSLGHDQWEALVRPAKKLKIGDEIDFHSPHSLSGEIADGLSDDQAGLRERTQRVTATVEGIGEMGMRTLRFHYESSFNEWLDVAGQMPLPPYIRQQMDDRTRYQTVYAKTAGSAAAPTAGLHFSEAFLAEIKRKGINVVYVTLHVGLGTFRPVNAEQVEDHVMHEEYYELGAEAARTINETRQNGGRVIAVGTTSVRTLEAAGRAVSLKQQKDEATQQSLDATAHGGSTMAHHGEQPLLLTAMSGWTDIFIYPGFNFQVVDAIITNFHLPRSSLLMLVSAFAGREHIMDAYDEAIKQGYRFFSFGDAMFIR